MFVETNRKSCERVLSFGRTSVFLRERGNVTVVKAFASSLDEDYFSITTMWKTWCILLQIL